MKLYIHGILDNAVGAYNAPLFFRSRLEAIRSFSDACLSPDSQWGKHPADYFLMYLGEFDDNTGEFSPVVPQRVYSAVEASQDAQRAGLGNVSV